MQAFEAQGDSRILTLSCSSVHESRVVDLQNGCKVSHSKANKVHAAADPIQFIAAGKPSHTSYLTNDK